MRALFVCSRNRLRSPTAEQIFSVRPNWETASAGLSPDAEERISTEIIDWADVIFVMETVHRRKLSSQFSSHLKSKRVICLDIPDDFDEMQPELIALLNAKMQAHFPTAQYEPEA